MSHPITFAILGDSVATGVGDYDPYGRPRGWCFHLASAFSQPINLIQVARSGAQSSEVKEIQLPRVLAYKPDIAALVVGGNDLLRNGFSPRKLYENLGETIAEFKALGTEVLMLQLHDPTQIVPLPRLLARVLRRRVEAVNQVYEKLVAEHQLVFLRTRTLPDIYQRHLWHFDRMHPSAYGHLILAKNFRDLLALRGWIMEDLDLPQISYPKPFERISWMLRNGTPWFVKRSFDLLPAALILIFMEGLRVCIFAVSQLLKRIKNRIR